MPEIPSEEMLEQMIHEEVEEIGCQPVGFRQIRKEIMKHVWEIADKLEAQGYILTHDMFRKILKQMWEEIKKLPACEVK